MNFPVESGELMVDNRRISTVCWLLYTGSSTDSVADSVDRGSINAVLRLSPGPVLEIDVAEWYSALPRPITDGRPWVELCMVASIDGTTTISGTSRELGNPADAAVLRALRASADVVIVGSTTAHAERYGAPRKPGQRVGVVTRSGNIDPKLPLFVSGAGFLITTASAPGHGLPAIRSDHDDVDLADALTRLDASVVHAEGGPTLNAALLEADLVDEVNLTVAPHLVGGSGHRLTAPSSAETLRRMELAHVCTDNDFLFLRYVRTAQRGSRTT